MIETEPYKVEVSRLNKGAFAPPQHMFIIVTQRRGNTKYRIARPVPMVIINDEIKAQAGKILYEALAKKYNL